MGCLMTCSGFPQTASCEQHLAYVILCSPGKEKVKPDAATAMLTGEQITVITFCRPEMLSIFPESANVLYYCCLAIGPPIWTVFFEEATVVSFSVNA